MYQIPVFGDKMNCLYLSVPSLIITTQSVIQQVSMNCNPSNSKSSEYAGIYNMDLVPETSCRNV